MNEKQKECLSAKAWLLLASIRKHGGCKMNVDLFHVVELCDAGLIVYNAWVSGFGQRSGATNAELVIDARLTWDGQNMPIPKEYLNGQ